MKKWYSLIDKVYRMSNLREAYRQVRANRGAPGIDGVTVEAFGEHLEEELAKLHHELKTGTYEPKPVSYTHLDVYKRQVRGCRISGVYPVHLLTARIVEQRW